MSRTRRTTPEPFAVARHQHAMIGRRVGTERFTGHDQVPEETATAIYAGVTGLGPTEDPIARAVADTMPDRFAALVRIDGIAAAFATTAQMEALAGASPGELERQAEAGWAAFGKIADQGGYITSGLGGDASAAWPVLKAIQEMPGADPEKIKRIVALAGRLLNALRGAAQRRGAPVPEEVIGIETGEDVTALVAEEYALLGLPPTEMEAYRRIAERQAHQLERRGREKKTRGPLVLAIDESGSMVGGGRDDRMIWAKAVGVAMTRLAWEGRRPVVWLAWSTASRSTLLRPGDAVGLAGCVARFLHGGTDTPAAIDVATREIQSLEREGHKGADVVLISDGTTDPEVAYRLPGAIDRLGRQGARLWSVAIELEFEGPLRDKAALYLPISREDMRNPQSVSRLSGAIKP